MEIDLINYSYINEIIIAVECHYNFIVISTPFWEGNGKIEYENKNIFKWVSLFFLSEDDHLVIEKEF